MCQYLVVQYPMNHQKYVSVSSYMVHGETSEIYASIRGFKCIHLHLPLHRSIYRTYFQHLKPVTVLTDKKIRTFRLGDLSTRPREISL
jgi:hypothetical protein